MFFRFVLPCLLLAVAISALPVPYAVKVDKIPADFKALIPQEVVAFYKGLTDEDKAVIMELTFNTEEEAIAALKSKSESLYNKVMVVSDLVKGKVNALDTEAKTYVEESIAAVRALCPAGGQKFSIAKVKETANSIVNGYKALSEAAKADLEGQFPQIAALAKNEKIQVLAKGYLQN